MDGGPGKQGRARERRPSWARPAGFQVCHWMTKTQQPGRERDGRAGYRRTSMSSSGEGVGAGGRERRAGGQVAARAKTCSPKRQGSDWLESSKKRAADSGSRPNQCRGRGRGGNSARRAGLDGHATRGNGGGNSGTTGEQSCGRASGWTASLCVLAKRCVEQRSSNARAERGRRENESRSG